MGRKNKNNNKDSQSNKNAGEQQTRNSKSGVADQAQQKQQEGQPQQKSQQAACAGAQVQQGQPQQGQQQQRPQQGQQQQKTQQSAWGRSQSEQEQKPQKGAWGGTQPQQGQKPQQKIPQQLSWRGSQSQQQQKPQQGGWGEAQAQQKPQQTSWMGSQSQQQQKPQQGGRCEAQAQQKPQQSVWGGGQPQQGGKRQQQTDRSNQGGPGLERGYGIQQKSGKTQQQSEWCQSQQRSSGSQQGGGGHEHKFQQRTGAQQQRGPSSSQGQQGRDDRRPLPQKIQDMSISDELPLPVMKTSCNGIVRGNLGTPGIVEVNYLKLDINNMPSEAYHYDVSIEPDRPKKFLRSAFEQCRLELFPNIISTFDGSKSCFTLQRLETPIDRKVEVPDSSNRMKEFRVQIKETDNYIVDLSSLRTYQNEKVSNKPMRALQVLEVVLASNNHARGIRAGRSFFRRPDDSPDLGDGYEAWTGLYQAAILGEQPLLNVDISHKSFPRESSLIDYLMRQNINPNQDLKTNFYRYKIVCSFLKGINIMYTPPPSFGSTPKQYKVLDIGEPASQKKFRNDDGKELTVAEYFKSKGYTLNYPQLNCLTVGSSVRPISLPMELCSIPGGQALNRKDQSNQVEKMVRYAATSTNRRKQKIFELLRFFDHNVNPIIREFGLRIGSNFIKVPMRLLTPPFMEYLQGKTVTTFKGAWRMDRNKFLICSNPKNGHKWAILYEERNCSVNYHGLEKFKSDVITTSMNLNMNLQNSADISTYTSRDLPILLKNFAKNGYDLVFVVLSDRGTAYSKIKQIAELEVGILTQCIKDKTIFKTSKDRTVFGNILLKVNGKLNGTNHKIASDKSSNLLSPIKNVMYLGADVTHPSPDQRHIPSVVGVAASHDQYGACYNCQYRLQRSTLETIEDMENIVRRHLEVYRTYQNCYPSQIIYYRDGVSDGQFPIIQRVEILAIKSACKKLNCDAKLTCTIVVKRHHTRFFPLTPPEHDRDFNNVKAGTVVDQHITHPNEVQFFMVSHQSIQGTARPTRYNVIFDESNFDINLLQQLTYNLCHLFPRCNRAVSYPAPAYLAHLVAFRGRVYLEGTQRFDKDLRREYDRRQIKAEFMNRNPMYFI